jgi:hypothetical protein
MDKIYIYIFMLKRRIADLRWIAYGAHLPHPLIS